MPSELLIRTIADAIDLSEPIADEDHARICDFVYKKIGVVIGKDKKSMVSSRLARRLRLYDLDDFGEYIRRIIDGRLPGEEQMMLDLLTTNETYLFREPAHFDFLRHRSLDAWDKQYVFRAWSAACSTGEEAYSMAMMAQDQLGHSAWEIIASDVSTSVLPLARKAKYRMDRSENIPREYLREYCKKGVNAEEGFLVVSKSLRRRVHFRTVNLISPLPKDLGLFDVIFLRNTLIYFDEPARRAIVDRVVGHLKTGGYFFVSHTETIAGFPAGLELVQPSIYRKIRRTPFDLGDL